MTIQEKMSAHSTSCLDLVHSVCLSLIIDEQLVCAPKEAPCSCAQNPISSPFPCVTKFSLLTGQPIYNHSETFLILKMHIHKTFLKGCLYQQFLVSLLFKLIPDPEAHLQTSPFKDTRWPLVAKSHDQS
jgi:hypothetical protein